MEWNETLSVGFKKIDDDHMALFRIIKELVDAINQHTCKYKIDEVVKFLEDYANSHFAMEERHMMESEYPEYLKHRAEHEKFRTTFSKLKRELDQIKASGTHAGLYELSVATDQVLVDWLLDHIAKVDMKLADFLKKYGA